MARYEHLKIFQRSLEFLEKIYLYVNHFPKSQKFALGQRIENAGVDLLMLIVEVNNTSIDKRPPLFKEIFLTLEKIRILVRLAHKLSFLSTKGYEILSGNLVELSKMLNGWEKASANQ